MSYTVKVQAFEGPLDLLLHLISKSKVQIEDIRIADITEQYLAYLAKMEQFDIEIASEFLVMAATLLHIKSVMLLPKGKMEEAETEGADPRQDLIVRLLEYKRYKEAGEDLKKREAVYTGIYSKLPEEMPIQDFSDLVPKGDAQCLYAAFALLFQKKGMTVRTVRVHHIARDPVSLGQRIQALTDRLAKEGEFTFFSLFSSLADRGEIILTFLALLEMLKENLIILKQSDLFNDILIQRRI
jgi:segregation and condensation protein A